MYNGNMQILIYENVNYTKVGSMQSISIELIIISQEQRALITFMQERMRLDLQATTEKVLISIK